MYSMTVKKQIAHTFVLTAMLAGCGYFGLDKGVGDEVTQQFSIEVDIQTEKLDNGGLVLNADIVDFYVSVVFAFDAKDSSGEAIGAMILDRVKRSLGNTNGWAEVVVHLTAFRPVEGKQEDSRTFRLGTGRFDRLTGNPYVEPPTAAEEFVQKIGNLFDAGLGYRADDLLDAIASVYVSHTGKEVALHIGQQNFLAPNVRAGGTNAHPEEVTVAG